MNLISEMRERKLRAMVSSLVDSGGLNDFTPQQRRVLLLRYLLGLNSEEIAKRIGVDSRRAVESLHGRAIEKLMS